MPASEFRRIQLPTRPAAGVPTPPPGFVNIFIDSADALVKTKDSAGVVAAVDAGGAAADLALSKKAPTGSVTVTAGCSAYVGDSYEVASGTSLEVSVGATFEVG